MPSSFIIPLQHVNLNVSPIGTMVYRAQRNSSEQIIDFHLDRLNTAALELLNRSESELVGKPLRQLVADNDAAYLVDQFRLVVASGRGVQFQMEFIVQRDVVPRTFLLEVEKLDQGVLVRCSDVLNQKKPLQEASQTHLIETIFESTVIGICAYEAVRDPESGKIQDFRYLKANHKAVQFINLTSEQVEGRLLSEVYPGYRTKSFFSDYVDVIETGQICHKQNYFTDLNLWVDATISKLGDGVLITFSDITKAKQEEAEKLVQAALHQQVIDNIHAGLLLARPVRNERRQIIDFHLILTNEYNARLMGRSVSEMTGDVVGNLFVNWQQSDLFRWFVDTVETGQVKRQTFYYDEYGAKGWFDGSFSCLDGCILYTYSDVTALKEAELVQQQQAELLEQVMNTTPTSIVVHESIRDEAGEIVDFRMVRLNQVAADLLQNPIEKIQYRRISRYFPGILETSLFTQYQQVVQTGISQRADVFWANRWFDISVARFGDGIVVAFQDITPKKESRRQLEMANLELKRSNENLESFAYVASHDLQEPLRKIVTFANILHIQYKDQFDADATDIIKRLTGSAERMRLLIQDILAYSRIKVRQDSLQLVNLNRVIEELKENELWTVLHQSKAQLHLNSLPTLLADSSQMHQLFQNLISNAIKFCLPDVTPAITVNCRIIDRSEGPAELMATTHLSFHEITVEDNGIGFDEKYINRIFQVFQRLHGKSKYAGSGIGLAICQKIIERHEGAITASSQLGKGSIFRVYLPVREVVD